MLNSQSPQKHQNTINKYLNGQSTPTLPKLLNKSPSYHNQNKKNQQYNSLNPPIRRSFSVAAIIHGQPINKSPNNHHYVDQLQRFKRDYASKQKQDRQNKRLNILKNIQRKRNLNLQRQKQIKQRQEENYLRRIVAQNQRALEVYKTGFQMNSFTNSIPVNPINLKYDDSLKGRYQKQIDQENKIKNLVRTHHLQTCGTSGYNIINGSTIDYTQKLLPKNESSYQRYGQNLQKYYSKFTFKPPTEQEIIQSRRARNFI